MVTIQKSFFQRYRAGPTVRLSSYFLLTSTGHCFRDIDLDSDLVHSPSEFFNKHFSMCSPGVVSPKNVIEGTNLKMYMRSPIVRSLYKDNFPGTIFVMSP
jgi:hypothetical protein